MTDEAIDLVIEKILTEELKPLYTSKDINARCTDTGNTALIFAAARSDILLVKRLLERGADPILRNLNGNNAFMIAICSKDEGIIKALLPYETTQSLNEENSDGKTPLAIATALEWVFGERAIMDAGGITPGMHMKENATPSQMRAEFFGFLQQSGSILSGGGSVPSRMLANIFVEKAAVDFPIDYFDYAFSNPDLRCLMTLANWACNVYKSKIFFFDSRHNESLFFGAQADGRLSFYNHNVYCSYDDVMSISNISIFFHEAMHLVMDFIYQNWAKPYTSQNIDHKNRFEVVLQKTKSRLDEMEPNLVLDTAKEAYDSIHSVYMYGPDDRASELIVRIPEILVRMGIDQGIKWLSHFEELMEYYNTVVMPDMKNYILNHDYLKMGFNARTATSPSAVESIMQMIYEREISDLIRNQLEEAHEKLSLDELERIKKAALFFKCESIVIKKCEEYFKERMRLCERIRLDEMQERELRNRQILDGFYLDPNNVTHLDYWSRQVTWPGGRDYKVHRIPHTVANIFEWLEKESLTDILPSKLLTEIHRLRKLESGSKISFFPVFSTRSSIVEQLKTMSDDDFKSSFSPGSSHGM